MQPRVTPQLLSVLELLLSSPEPQTTARALIAASGLPGAVVHPMLGGLEQAGWLSSQWRPPRKRRGHPRGAPRLHYRLTDLGMTLAARTVAGTRTSRRRKAWR